jgi:hypothetical protein
MYGIYMCVGKPGLLASRPVPVADVGLDKERLAPVHLQLSLLHLTAIKHDLRTDTNFGVKFGIWVLWYRLLNTVTAANIIF